MIVDSHIHLSHFSFDGEFPYLSCENNNYVIQRGTRDQLIESLKSMGIEYCINPSIDIDSIHDIISLAERYPGFIFSAIGVHPTRTYQYNTVDKQGTVHCRRLPWKRHRQIEPYLNHSSVVAIGETGLDYHLPRKDQHRLRQIMWFDYQLKLADKNRLPVILHIRNADTDALKILKKHQKRIHGGVYHCFNGTVDIAKQYTQLGIKLGIRNAISIGGDSDTIAAIAGGIAEAYYGVPADLRLQALTFLDQELLDIVNAFESKFGMKDEK